MEIKKLNPEELEPPLVGGVVERAADKNSNSDDKDGELEKEVDPGANSIAGEDEPGLENGKMEEGDRSSEDDDVEEKSFKKN